MPIPPLPVTTPFTGPTGSGVSQYWLNWFQTIQRQLAPIRGPYANDVAAAAAGIGIGQHYYQTSGQVVVRLT